MRPDRLTVRLRPRSGFEAIDLGFALTRRHAGDLWRAWLLLVLPVMLLLAIGEHLLWRTTGYGSGLLLWWAKPFYDAVLLLVLSRAVFGERLTQRELRRELRRVAGSIAGALGWRRLSLSRSFLLPAHLLEGLRGAARAPRLQQLREDTNTPARTLTMVCSWMEFVVVFGVLALLVWLTPDILRDQLFNNMLRPESTLEEAGWQVLYAATITLIEPFYVAAGFALYLNRRTWLEAWDIEVALKRVANRLPAPEPRDGTAQQPAVSP